MQLSHATLTQQLNAHDISNIMHALGQMRHRPNNPHVLVAIDAVLPGVLDDITLEVRFWGVFGLCVCIVCVTQTKNIHEHHTLNIHSTTHTYTHTHSLTHAQTHRDWQVLHWGVLVLGMCPKHTLYC